MQKLEAVLRNELKGLHRAGAEIDVSLDLPVWKKVSDLLIKDGVQLRSEKQAVEWSQGALAYLHSVLDPIVSARSSGAIHGDIPKICQYVATFICETSRQAGASGIRNALKELMQLVDDYVLLSSEVKRDQLALRFVVRIINSCLKPMTGALVDLCEKITWQSRTLVQQFYKMVVVGSETVCEGSINGKPLLWMQILHNKSETPELLMVWYLIDHMATIISVVWPVIPPEAEQIIYFLEIISQDKCALLVTGVRAFEKLEGDEAFSQMLIPSFIDMMSLEDREIDVSTYTLAAFVLACIGATSAVSGNFWGYSTVLDQLTKLFKFPKHRISVALMHGALDDAQTKWSNIRGKSPGGLADALLHLAKNIHGAPLSFKKDLRRKLLMLFSDFALLMPNDTFIEDLGSLLPSVSAALCNTKASIVMGRISSALSGGDLSLEALNKIQEDDRIHMAAFRHLWFVSGIYDLASMGRSSSARWPSSWAKALFYIAERTPILLIGSEQQQESVFLDHIGAEYGGWLPILGKRAEQKNVLASLTDILPQALNGSLNISHNLCCHILTIAYQSIAHASLQDCSLPAMRSPLDSIIVHSQFSLSKSSEYAWYKEIIRASFSKYTKRLQELHDSSSPMEEEQALESAKYATGIMIESLVQQGPNEDIPPAMIKLLKEIFPLFPALFYSKEILNGLIRAATSEFEMPLPNLIENPKILVADPRQVSFHSVAFSFLLSLIEDAASRAPSAAEAVVAENLRQLSIVGGSSAKFTSRVTPSIMHAIEKGRNKCNLPDTTGQYKGVIAWSSKIKALGLIDGFRDTFASTDELTQHILESLLEKIDRKFPDTEIAESLLQVTALCHQYPGSDSLANSLQLLAWTPVTCSSMDVMQAACLAWSWILSSELEPVSPLLDNILSAWLSSKNQSMGIFTSQNEKQDEADSDEEIYDMQLAWIVFLTEVRHLVLLNKTYN